MTAKQSLTFAAPRIVHLVTAAKTPSARDRLAVCFGAICRPGWSLDHDPAIHEPSGLPYASGTKVQSEITCPACRWVIDVEAAWKELADAQAKSRAAMDARMALAAGSTRARSTTANARWARAAEHRDRCAARLEKLVAGGMP